MAPPETPPPDELLALDNANVDEGVAAEDAVLVGAGCDTMSGGVVGATTAEVVGATAEEGTALEAAEGLADVVVAFAVVAFAVVSFFVVVNAGCEGAL